MVEEEKEIGLIKRGLLAEAGQLYGEAWEISMKGQSGKTYAEKILHLAIQLPELRKHLRCFACQGLLSHFAMVAKSEGCEHHIFLMFSPTK